MLPTGYRTFLVVSFLYVFSFLLFFFCFVSFLTILFSFFCVSFFFFSFLFVTFLLVFFSFFFLSVSFRFFSFFFRFSVYRYPSSETYVWVNIPTVIVWLSSQLHKMCTSKYAYFKQTFYSKRMQKVNVTVKIKYTVYIAHYLCYSIIIVMNVKCKLVTSL